MSSASNYNKADFTDFFKGLRNRKDDQVVQSQSFSPVDSCVSIAGPGTQLGRQPPLECSYALIVQLFIDNLVFILLLFGNSQLYVGNVVVVPQCWTRGMTHSLGR